MQEHFSPSEEPAPPRMHTESVAIVQARIDAYLNRTCAPLFLSLSQEEAVEYRAEMRSHLESLVAAHIELGSSETLAVTQALEQFGKEQNIARAWTRECEETRVETGRGTFWSAMRLVMVSSLRNEFAFSMILAAYAWTKGCPSFYSMNVGQLGPIGMGLVFGEALLFPIYLGVMLGRRTRGTVFTASLLALPIVETISRSLSGEIYQRFGLFPQPAHSNLHWTFGEYLFYFGVSYSVTLGCAAIGGAAGRWRRRKLRLAESR